MNTHRSVRLFSFFSSLLLLGSGMGRSYAQETSGDNPSTPARIERDSIADTIPPGVQDNGIREIRSRLVDAQTGEGIPYASIEYGVEKGIITNEEGSFRISIQPGERVFDSLHIQSMGYEKLSLPLNGSIDTLIPVASKAIDLREVYLFNREFTIDEIMENTWNNLGANYEDFNHKSRFFVRRSDLNEFTRFDIEFQKSSIPELNRKFLDSVVDILPRKSEYYREALGDWYHGPDTEKVVLIKGAELYDKSNDGSLENLGERLETIFARNVKRDSYLKIKSGIIGTKVPVDSIMKEMEEAKASEDNEEEDDFFFKGIKSLLSSVSEKMYFREDAELPVIDKARRYEYSLEGYEEIDGQGVFVVSYEPKGSADFRGRLYIGMEDFAILRMDFENVKRLKNIRLFGFMFRALGYQGSIRFGRTAQGPYALKFGEITKHNKIGIRRPLKIVEKNKNVRGRRKQNELKMNLDLIAESREIYQWVIFDTDPLESSDLQAVEENPQFQPTYMARYDPNFWNDATTLEPNTAIRSFQAAPQD